MAKFPLRVKRRAEVLCDTVKGAVEDLGHFRSMGYTEVWVEDLDGAPIDEKSECLEVIALSVNVGFFELNCQRRYAN